MAVDDRRGLGRWIAGGLCLALIFTVAWWWRQHEPRRPSIPLAEMALQQFERWRAGQLPPAEAGLERYEEVPAWLQAHPIELPMPGERLTLTGPMPHLPMAIDGVGPIEVAQAPALLLRLGDGTHSALLFVFDLSAAGLLGHQRNRLLDEWNHYGYAADEAGVMVWRRQSNIFVVVTTTPLTSGGLGDDPIAWILGLFEDEKPINRPPWLPPPTTSRPGAGGLERRYVEPVSQEVADPGAGQQAPAPTPAPSAQAPAVGAPPGLDARE